MSARLDDLARWLHVHLDEPRPLFRAGPPEVASLGLALEPADLPDRVEVDALFLHRALRLGGALPALGVLNAHDGFDLQLTTGPNLRLAGRLGWQEVRPLFWQGRPVGLTATPPEGEWRAFHRALTDELRGEDRSWGPVDPSRVRVALMNAMNPELLGLTHSLGVNVYLTGQLRPSAQEAARALGLGVVALGHRRTELWGLRQLARELEAAFPGLRTEVYPG
ncbi:Nif3-like dinuclear metal center hexameric protein [Deinococcus planocerae]|uniref:Nif3-like dinuclear metal center hexameric protein n=1 Tax=Deinococcus planocerae TaxID=1737569 RepID=UPI000C7F6CCC|nr:Nif3-like dinuclear metal center hexameric protein [Deinococcus planocerae]